jgi:hypothetical protein
LLFGLGARLLIVASSVAVESDLGHALISGWLHEKVKTGFCT